MDGGECVGMVCLSGSTHWRDASGPQSLRWGVFGASGWGVEMLCAKLGRAVRLL